MHACSSSRVNDHHVSVQRASVIRQFLENVRGAAEQAKVSIHCFETQLVPAFREATNCKRHYFAKKQRYRWRPGDGTLFSLEEGKETVPGQFHLRFERGKLVWLLGGRTGETRKKWENVESPTNGRNGEVNMDYRWKVQF